MPVLPWAPMGGAASAQAQSEKPSIILIVSDDFGYGDSGVYGGGRGRGMPIPNLDRLANEGMTFFSFDGARRVGMRAKKKPLRRGRPRGFFGFLRGNRMMGQG